MFAKKKTILLVDDDPDIRSLAADYLEKHGLRCKQAGDGVAMFRAMESTVFDLIVLDVMLPGDDGLALCRKLRETESMPIIMLSAMSEDTDRIVGLEVGADDYLAKPFNPRELLARIKALLRRSEGQIATGSEGGRLTALRDIAFLDWRLDRNRRLLMAPDGLTVPLSGGEFDLLVAFLENPQRVMTRDQLLDLTRGRQAGPFDRTIDVQVARLRKKLEEDPKNPTLIVTVRGGGYRFDAPVQCVDGGVD